ncbi:hypothetical protein, partial [Streptomyces venezuelae]|uniref:hypothetical protein n=1 Tax=Streptomyces venezuelae TaxID=54571 RepID=UPI00351B7356
PEVDERGGRVVGRGDPAEQRAGVGEHTQDGGVGPVRRGEGDQPGELRAQGVRLGRRVGRRVQQIGAGPAAQQMDRGGLGGTRLPDRVEGGGPSAQLREPGTGRRADLGARDERPGPRDQRPAPLSGLFVQVGGAEEERSRGRPGRAPAVERRGVQGVRVVAGGEAGLLYTYDAA